MFLGLMDRVTDQQITRAFSAMLGNRLRKLFFDRMAAQDFTPNKDKVIHRILGLLPEGPESEKAKEEA